MKRTREKNEKGLITVEAVLSLVPYILVVMGIISFINIFMIHNKIQYAIYQVGSELSAYTYVYQAMGIRDADLKLKEDIDRETQEIDKTIKDTTAFLDQISSLKSSAGDLKSDVTEWNFSELETDVNQFFDETGKTYEAGSEAANSAITLVSDPMDLMRNLVFFGIEKVEKETKSFLLAEITKSMIPRYLEKRVGSNKISDTDYLLAAGVTYQKDGKTLLNFSKSQLFSDTKLRMIDIVVEYDVSIFFFKLFMKDPKIHVVQRCAVPAWLDGDGVKYTPKTTEEGKK